MGPQEKPRLLPIPMDPHSPQPSAPCPLSPSPLSNHSCFPSQISLPFALSSRPLPFRRQIWQQPHEHVAASVAALGQPAAAIGCWGSTERELGRADCRFGSGTVRVCRCRLRIYLHVVTCAAVQYICLDNYQPRERGIECSWGVHHTPRYTRRYSGAALLQRDSVTASASVEAEPTRPGGSPS